MCKGAQSLKVAVLPTTSFHHIRRRTVMLKWSHWGLTSAQTYCKGKLPKGVIPFDLDRNSTQTRWGLERNSRKSNRKSVTEDVFHLPMSWSKFSLFKNMPCMFCEIPSQKHMWASGAAGGIAPTSDLECAQSDCNGKALEPITMEKRSNLL